MANSIMPQELQQVIDLHRQMFAGWSMQAETPPPADEPPAEQPSAEQPAPELGDAGKRALDVERKARRDAEKKLAEANKRLQEIADAEKTELERATEAAQKALADAEAARQELARERIARKHKLSDDDTALLSGDEEQMERLASRLGAAAQPGTPIVPGEGTYQPAPGGTREQAAKAEAAGDQKAALALKARQLMEMRHPTK